MEREGGREGGRERKGGEREMEEGKEEEEQGCQGEGGRRRGGQKGGSKATCDQRALQFDSRSHDTGPSLLKCDWSITTGAFALDQVTHCIWCLSISLYLLLASWS